MFKHYLTIGFRNLIKHRNHAVIAIVGLAIGLTCAIFMFLFVREEWSYDRFHKKSDRIFRVVREVKSIDGDLSYTPLTSGPLADALHRDFPEVEAAVRIWMWAVWIQHEGQTFSESVAFVDLNFLSVFNYPLITGNRQNALKVPRAIVITEPMAHRYFGDANPLGETLTIDRESLSGDYTVTGVVQLPQNTALKFDFLISAAPPVIQQHLATWQDRQFFSTYVVLSPNASVEDFEQKLPDFIAQYKGDTWRNHNTYHLQPLTRIHLYSNADYPNMEPWRGQNITSLYLVSLTCLFVLLIACVNFVNLTTARSTVRTREVGIRKTVGAQRRQLIGQFLCESFVMTAGALVLSLGFAEILMPIFNDLTGKSLTFFIHIDITLIAGLIGTGLSVGLLSGLYPAFVLSGFHPLSFLGRTTFPQKGGRFRNALVVIQFSLSIFLLIATGIVYHQLAFIQNKDLGFDADEVIVLPIFRDDRTLQKPSVDRLSMRYQQVKQAFLSHPDIRNASAARQRTPGDGGQIQNVRSEITGNEWEMRFQIVDEDFLDVYRMTLISGQNFSTEMPNGFILNETAMRRLGWTDAIGKTLTVGQRTGTVVGVVKDYHSASFYETMEPVILYMSPPDYLYLSLKINPKEMLGLKAFLQKTWTQWIPQRPFKYYYADEFINRAYSDDKRFGQVAGIASLLAIFLACLGLLGLASFLTTRRTKEIGIRKVLGATVPDIAAMLSRDFLKPVLVANLIAWPIAYWTMNRWLEHFAYRTGLPVWIFLSGSFLVCLLAIASVCIQAIQTARANPIDALRYE